MLTLDEQIDRAVTEKGFPRISSKTLGNYLKKFVFILSPEIHLRPKSRDVIIAIIF